VAWAEICWFGLAALLAAFLTWRVRAHSLARGVLDVPNSRSSHTVATARGGGLAIVTISVLGILISFGAFGLPIEVSIALFAGGVLVGAIGYADDRWSLPALPRFGVHLIAAAIAVFLIYFVARDTDAAMGITGWIISVVAVIAVVWSINLFNFMDGIDGIAASQALFVILTSALLPGVGGANDLGLDASFVLLVSAGACLGFLVWNWPPAKIFMGDVGSGFLGFWLAALALWLDASGLLSYWTAITLNAVFIADATVTLVHRILQGERWYEAHRSHAYQILARRWGGHFKVTMSLWLVNLAVVLPLGFASHIWPQAAPAIAVSSVTVLACVCLFFGAGSKAP